MTEENDQRKHVL